MLYNFSPPKRPSKVSLCLIGTQLLFWMISLCNGLAFMFEARPEITVAKPLVYSQLKKAPLEFLNQATRFYLRLLTVDIYQQDMILKGLTTDAKTFQELLTFIRHQADITSHELLEWRKKRNGTWYFCLRLVFL